MASESGRCPDYWRKREERKLGVLPLLVVLFLLFIVIPSLIVFGLAKLGLFITANGVSWILDFVAKSGEVIGGLIYAFATVATGVFLVFLAYVTPLVSILLALAAVGRIKRREFGFGFYLNIAALACAVLWGVFLYSGRIPYDRTVNAAEHASPYLDGIILLAFVVRSVLRLSKTRKRTAIAGKRS